MQTARPEVRTAHTAAMEQIRCRAADRGRQRSHEARAAFLPVPDPTVGTRRHPPCAAAGHKKGVPPPTPFRSGRRTRPILLFIPTAHRTPPRRPQASCAPHRPQRPAGHSSRPHTTPSRPCAPTDPGRTGTPRHTAAAPRPNGYAWPILGPMFSGCCGFGISILPMALS